MTSIVAKDIIKLKIKGTVMRNAVTLKVYGFS